MIHPGDSALRVAICSRFPQDIDQPRGGVESATVALVRGLTADPLLDVHVVTLERTVRRPVVEQFGRVTVHRLPRSRWPMLLDVFAGPGRGRIDGYVRTLAPDIVHFQETYGFGARGYRVPVLFTVHGFDSLNLRTEKRPGWYVRAPLWRLAERLGIGAHRHLVSIAPYVAAELRAVSRGEITAIPNAISVEFFGAPRREVPGRILFAGWLNPRKNLLSVLAAVRKLVEGGMRVQLHAAGAADDPVYAAKLDRYIQAHGLSGHVRMLGRIGRDDLRHEMSEACALVLPSLQENAPMIIAEALAAGLPVVATAACGIPDMIEEGTTGFLIDPLDVDMISDRLRRLIVDDRMRTRMSDAARRAAHERWHPDIVAAATIELYRRLIEGARGSSAASAAPRK